MRALPLAAAFASGLVFAAGLGISGMTRPAKVLAFLDVFGTWDPSLGAVMVGAISVFGVVFALARRRDRPIFAARFVPPDRVALDRDLVVGAAIFGIGWGIGGFCPGPAIVAMAATGWPAGLFVAAMLLGSRLCDHLTARRARAP